MAFPIFETLWWWNLPCQRSSISIRVLGNSNILLCLYCQCYLGCFPRLWLRCWSVTLVLFLLKALILLRNQVSTNFNKHTVSHCTCTLLFQKFPSDLHPHLHPNPNPHLCFLNTSYDFLFQWIFYYVCVCVCVCIKDCNLEAIIWQLLHKLLLWVHLWVFCFGVCLFLYSFIYVRKSRYARWHCLLCGLEY